MSENTDAKYEAIKLVRSVNHKSEHNAPTAKWGLVRNELATLEMKRMRGDEGHKVGGESCPDTGKIYLTGATYVWPEFSSFSSLQ